MALAAHGGFVSGLTQRRLVGVLAAKLTPFSRRRFLLAAALLLSPAAAVCDARCLEPTWLKIRHVRLGRGKPSHRLAHFTDLHHKGDCAYLQRVVKHINALSPDLVCFTGDIIEESRFAPEALRILSGVKSPMYGVPGNHDYRGKLPFQAAAKCFQGTGGAWLLDQQRISPDGRFCISGASGLLPNHPLLRPEPKATNLLLMHYPAWVKKLGTTNFDLILAGHSHGGQVRLPLYGPVYIPFGVDEYDLGRSTPPRDHSTSIRALAGSRGPSGSAAARRSLCLRFRPLSLVEGFCCLNSMALSPGGSVRLRRNSGPEQGPG